MSRKQFSLNPFAVTREERERYSHLLESERGRLEAKYDRTVQSALGQQIDEINALIIDGSDGVSFSDKPIEDAYREIFTDTSKRFALATWGARKSQHDIDDQTEEEIDREIEQYVLITIPFLANKSRELLRRLITSAKQNVAGEAVAGISDAQRRRNIAEEIDSWYTRSGEFVSRRRAEHLVVASSSFGTKVGVTKVREASGEGQYLRVWNSQLDGRQRPWHGAAHGQERYPDELFRVGGEKLEFPGDASKGASPSNFMNCRCYLTYMEPDDFVPKDFAEQRDAAPEGRF